MLALRVGVGVNANVSVPVGGEANFGVFRYQHVGIPNAKLWRSGSKPMRGPNANGFASQWNIGLKQLATSPMSEINRTKPWGHPVKQLQ